MEKQSYRRYRPIENEIDEKERSKETSRVLSANVNNITLVGSSAKLR